MKRNIKTGRGLSFQVQAVFALTLALLVILLTETCFPLLCSTVFLTYDVLFASNSENSHKWLIAARAYPGFSSMKRLGVFLLPLDQMLFHRRLLRFRQQFAGTYLYSLVERATVRVSVLPKNITQCPWPRLEPARSRVDRTNHEATAIAHFDLKSYL